MICKLTVDVDHFCLTIKIKLILSDVKKTKNNKSEINKFININHISQKCHVV